MHTSLNEIKSKSNVFNSTKLPNWKGQWLAHSDCRSLMRGDGGWIDPGIIVWIDPGIIVWIDPGIIVSIFSGPSTQFKQHQRKKSFPCVHGLKSVEISWTKACITGPTRIYIQSMTLIHLCTFWHSLDCDITFYEITRFLSFYSVRKLVLYYAFPGVIGIGFTKPRPPCE